MMNFSEMIITKHENVIKTFVNTDSTSFMKNRFSSGIIVVLCGKLIFEFDDKTIVCDRNHPLFLPEGLSYKFYCEEYAESLLFNFKVLSDNLSPFALDNIDQGIAQEYFDRIDNLSSKPNPSVHMIFMAYYEFFSIIFPASPDTDKAEEFINKAEEIILKKYSDAKFTIEDLSNEVNISNVYLRKLFVKYRAMPPSKYLTNIRMNKAKLFLRDTKSVSETAIMVGYSDIYQFSRAFKNHTGLSPTNYLTSSSML